MIHVGELRLRIPRDTTAIHHFEDFNQLLSEIRIEPSKVCLVGSTTLALLGVRANEDIDFIATSEARTKITEFAQTDPDSKVIRGVRTQLREHVQMLINDRLDTAPYLFGLDDDTVIRNSRYHFTVDGYKFLRPELLLSMKGAKRRGKDIEDIDLIEDSGLPRAEWWDWELVKVVPTWERTFATRRPMDRYIGPLKQVSISLRERGLLRTLWRSLQFIGAHATRRNTRRNGNLWQLRNCLSRCWRISPSLAPHLEDHIALPNLISRQYDTDGSFCGDDLLQAILALEKGDMEIHTAGRSDVRLSPDGRIFSGDGAVAYLIHSWEDELPGQAPGKIIKVDCTRRQSAEESQLLKDRTVSVNDLEAETVRLLKQTGAAFYAILWPAMFDEFDEAERLIERRVDVIDSEQYILNTDIATFAREIYRSDTRGEN